MLALGIALLMFFVVASRVQCAELPDLDEPLTAEFRLPLGRSLSMGSSTTVPIALALSRGVQAVHIRYTYAPDAIEPGFFVPAAGFPPDCAYLSHAGDGRGAIAAWCPMHRVSFPSGLFGTLPITAKIPATRSLLTFQECQIDGHPIPCDALTRLIVRP